MSFKSHIEVRVHNLKHVYEKKESYLITFVSSFLIGIIMFYFTNFESIKWNLGLWYASSQVVLQILISIFFGINMALLWCKLRHSAKINSTEASSVSFASIISVIVSGCPACGITLASYLGIASLFASLPLLGMELKILGLILLVYSTDSLAKNLHSCSIKGRKKKSFFSRLVSR